MNELLQTLMNRFSSQPAAPAAPPANPMGALRKASSIGADPRAEANTRMMQKINDMGGVKYGSAPLPWPGTGGVGKDVLDTLRKAKEGGYFPVQETLGERLPEFTPTGTEEMHGIVKATPATTVVDPVLESFKQKWTPLLTRLGLR